ILRLRRLRKKRKKGAGAGISSLLGTGSNSSLPSPNWGASTGQTALQWPQTRHSAGSVTSTRFFPKFNILRTQTGTQSPQRLHRLSSIEIIFASFLSEYRAPSIRDKRFFSPHPGPSHIFPPLREKLFR